MHALPGEHLVAGGERRRLRLPQRHDVLVQLPHLLLHHVELLVELPDLRLERPAVRGEGVLALQHFALHGVLLLLGGGGRRLVQPRR